jgi:4-amino-4-deoxy-L-arabinose transferase-like glycosyltransferase
MSDTQRTTLALLLLCGLALALRLVVWQWREFYPLGGDEREYFQQALTLLRDWRYEELRLMRPPLYGFFLAGSIVLVDSLVQQLRLVQAIISAATVLPVWLLTHELARIYQAPPPVQRWAPLLAGLLCALSYTLAVYATELLTETLFLFGLSGLFWLLLRAAAPGTRRPLSAGAAGGVLALLCLTRSVALVLLPLGALWLLLARRDGWRLALPFALAAVLLVAPWTARNVATYGGLIIIDTTGGENLWLDNDPAGREAVKAQLYAMGDDRAARQQLATERGIEAITSDPQRFAAKAWGELQQFFALEWSDDMRERRVIWLPPAEVWARLLLGDGLWLLLLLAGALGLCALRPPPAVPPARGWLADPRWLLVPWALYTLLTALVFHVELRYRLPLYPVLLPAAALALLGLGRARAHLGRHGLALGGVLAALLLALTLLHRPYPVLAWHLGWKHWHLAQAEQHLAAAAPAPAEEAAQAALAHDPDSVLARVALAQAALQAGRTAEAAATLRATIEMLPAHPQPHLLYGHLLREQGELEAARRELAYETNSLQDLQAWAWEHFDVSPPPTLDVGGELDLGMVRGFTAAERAGGTTWRWTTTHAALRLGVPAAPAADAADICAAHAPDTVLLRLRLAPGRPPTAPAPTISISSDHQPPTPLALTAGWHDYVLPLAGVRPTQRDVVVHLHSPTFRPRTYNPASDDGRSLGVQVARASVHICPASR